MKYSKSLAIAAAYLLAGAAPAMGESRSPAEPTYPFEVHISPGNLPEELAIVQYINIDPPQGRLDSFQGGDKLGSLDGIDSIYKTGAYSSTWRSFSDKYSSGNWPQNWSQLRCNGETTLRYTYGKYVVGTFIKNDVIRPDGLFFVKKTIESKVESDKSVCDESSLTKSAVINLEHHYSRGF
jgi:hypothetical protein